MNFSPFLGGCTLLAAALLTSCAPYDPYVYGAPPARVYPGYGYAPYGYAPYGYGPARSSLSVGWFSGGWWGGRSSWWGRDRYDHRHPHAAPTRTVTGYRTVHPGTYQRDPRPLEPFASGSRHSAVTPRSPISASSGTFDRGSPSSLRASSSLPAIRSAPPAASRPRESRPPTLTPSRPSSSMERGPAPSSGSPRASELRAATGGRSSVLTSSRGDGEARFSRERR
jgi:hypothetical protein